MRIITTISPVLFLTLEAAENYLRKVGWEPGHAGAWINPKICGHTRDIRKIGAFFRFAHTMPWKGPKHWQEDK